MRFGMAITGIAIAIGVACPDEIVRLGLEVNDHRSEGVWREWGVQGVVPTTTIRRVPIVFPAVMRHARSDDWGCVQKTTNFWFGTGCDQV